MTLGRRVLVTLLLTILAGPVGAQDRALTRPGDGSVLDRVIGERASARRVLTEARARLVQALDPIRDDSIGPATDMLLEQAMARYDVVVRVRPDDVDAWLERGLAAARFRRTMPDGRIERRLDEAITSLERARTLDPHRDEGWVAFELAVLRTEQHDYAGAAHEYARALAADVPSPTAVGEVSHAELIAIYMFRPGEPATVLGNWAEVTMLGGDPRGAIELYRRAHDAAPLRSTARALALWGLALAEERTGDHGDAVLDAGRAIDADPIDHGTPDGAALAARHGVFASLHLPWVSFEPSSEIHAYEALGHEALAARATTAEAHASELDSALRSTRYFLAEGGRQSVYAAIAERSEARLAALASERSRP